jgi:hypothetical protein
MKLTVSPEDKTRDITFEVDTSLAQTSYAARPIPKDIELIAGVYALEWDPEAACMYSRGATVDNVLKLKKLPSMKSKNPKFFGFQFDSNDENTYLYCAADESKGTGKGYDTIYFDTNRNLDLSDDKPVQLAIENASGEYKSCKTEWITVSAYQGSENADRTNHPIAIQFFGTAYKDELYPGFSRKGTWAGTLETNKGKIKCLVVDHNANGIYNEQTARDYVSADLNQTGKSFADPYSQQALFQMNVSLVAGKGYEIRVNEVGNEITISPYTGPMGKILVQSTDVQGVKCDVRTLSIDGLYIFESYDGNPINIPAGKHKIVSCELVTSSKGPSRMTLGCTTDIQVDVQADHETVVDITGKLTSELTVDESTLKPGKTGSINWTVKIDDNVTGGIRFDNYDKSPDITICDKAGKEISKLKAGYT